MREILFRGKRKDNAEWVYGAYCGIDCDSPFGEMKEKSNIIKYDKPCDGFWFEVHKESVGQYTGQKDENEKRIFEGDIVTVRSSGIDEDDGYGVVSWDAGDSLFVIVFEGLTISFDNVYGRECEIVGNRFDNPELLGVLQ